VRTRTQDRVEKKARMVSVPSVQLCDVCGRKKAPERHFLTVPTPTPFIRICDKDWVAIKREVRKRVEETVKTIFDEFIVKTREKA